MTGEGRERAAFSMAFPLERIIGPSGLPKKKVSRVEHLVGCFARSPRRQESILGGFSFGFLCFCVVRSFYNCFGAHTPLRYNSYSPCFVATFISKSDSTGVRQMGHLLLCPRNIRAHAPHMHM